MLTSIVAGFALSLVAQIPPPGGASVPRLVVGPAKTYLVASGKPTLAITMPPPIGMKPSPSAPLTVPTTPFKLRLGLDDNVVAWLRTLNREPVFTGMIARCDASGRVLEAFNILRVRTQTVGFPEIAAATGGAAYVDVTLAPASVSVNKTPPPVAAPRSVSPMRVLGCEMRIKDKPLGSLARVLAFDLNLAATEYGGTMFFEMSSNLTPGSSPVGTGQLTIRLQALARTSTLTLGMKDIRTTMQNPRRLVGRATGVTFS